MSRIERISSKPKEGDGKISGLPELGFPIGCRQLRIENGLIQEVYRRAILIGWHESAHDRCPIVRFKDGSQQTLHSLQETDWAPPIRVYVD